MPDLSNALLPLLATLMSCVITFLGWRTGVNKGVVERLEKTNVQQEKEIADLQNRVTELEAREEGYLKQIRSLERAQMQMAIELNNCLAAKGKFTPGR